ncbi:single-stranded DNA-binding protein [Glutamicibacter arilaitensis]|uniref:Single-stranded DNA-binding protein n=1 Tax=Glutamicibacter arilaitensis TaxID=256701 RepID=A0A4Y8TYM4_9MICC|nr:single-stranded DNA-binding protein [Glutamicibacter arilaitensis]TFH57305.1 single-stranded DNA-binding protein [Glutamicibacter arilaitensis]
MGQTAFHGNLGKIHGLKVSNDGKPRISFSVGEGHSKFNKQTNQWDKTGSTWRNVTVFGKRAETLAEVLQEGAKQQLVVIGREETREYEHNGEKRESLDCIADIVGIVPSAPQGNSNGFQQSAQQSAPQQSQPQQGGGWNAPAADPWSTGNNPAQGNNGGGWGNPQQSEAPF